MGPALPVISAVATVGGTIASYSAQRKAAKAQQKQQELSTQRSQRQAIREAQIRRAQAISAGAQLGGLGGSALEGGLSSLGSQLGSGLGFSTQMSALSADISKYSSLAQTFGGIANLGLMGMQRYGAPSMGTSSETTTKAPTRPSSNQLYMVGPQY
jgi:hypothetical protein